MVSLSTSIMKLAKIVTLKTKLDTLTEEEYYDEYIPLLSKKFPQAVHELDNYEPLEQIIIEYVVIARKEKADLKYWLDNKIKIEGAPVQSIVDKYGKMGSIKSPVLLDTRNDFCIEGRHRLAAALKYNLDVPAILVVGNSSDWWSNEG